MKPQKFNNLVGFLDVLFIITMTFVALFVLAIIQIKQIEVTAEDHQALQRQYEQAMADLTKIRRISEVDKDKLDAAETQLAQAQASLSSMQRTITEKNNLLEQAEEETEQQKHRAEQLASKVEDLDQQVAKLRGMGNWRSNAKVAIEITWPKVGTGLSDDDIDIYIEAPDKSVTYFGKRIGPGLFIDRDDLGNAAITDVHNEVTRFFTLLDGSRNPYLVNLHVYKKNSRTPTPVTFKLYHITESDAKVVFEKTYTMRAQNDIQPTVEIFTQPSRANPKNHEYKSYSETTRKIAKIVQYAERARLQNRQTSTTTQPSSRPVTRLAPTSRPIQTIPTPTRQRVEIKDEDQDPRFKINPSTSGQTRAEDGTTSGTGTQKPTLIPVPNRSTKDNE